MILKKGTFNGRLISLVGLTLIVFFGLGSISIVWLRMEISSVAKNCGKIEGKMEVVARNLHELRAERSKSLRPSTLAVMVEGRLAMPKDGNTFHISRNEMDSVLGTNRQGGLFEAGEFAGTR